MAVLAEGSGMNNERTDRIGIRDYNEGVPPPPRLLLWLVVGIFVVLIVGGITALLFLSNRPSPSTLLSIAIIVAPVVTVGSILAAILLRSRLPKRFSLWLTLGWVMLWAIAVFIFIVVFRNSLAPGQRETVKFYLPFMTMFEPPLPAADTSLPTPVPNQAGGISPEDLLSAPLGLATPTSALITPSAQPSPTTGITPTAQPTSVPQVTATQLTQPTAIAATSEPTSPTESVSGSANASLPLPPSSARLNGITPIKQGWNNCGPANITMALTFYGWRDDQEVAVSFLKPEREDKNVNPWEMVAFVNERSQVRALWRVGGDVELLKQLIANNLPVVVETGYLYEGSDWLGHYETLVGYDDARQVFYVYDSWLGTGENGSGLPKAYDEFDSFWQAFNRTFIVLYKPDEEGLVRSLLGERADVTRADELAAEAAQTEAQANPQNAYTWFNIGSTLTKLGQYEEATAAFDRARQLQTLPWRMLWYQFGMYEAYFNVGRYNEILALVEANLNNGGTYVEETYYWQGRALAAQGDKARAAAAFRQALNHHPGYTEAQAALNALNS
jgi:hypothetical protein